MRVTNSMISNSSQAHIANAKNQLMTAENQYTTQKKILRPSDDPAIAIRSLQLRTTYTQIQQYVEKNVQDGMSWMDTTETALKNVNTILENMKGYLNQGANDYLEKDERTSVVAVLKQYAKSILEDEGNADYSGRYMFTGYRTDTSLIFPDETTNLDYTITEKFTATNLKTVTRVESGLKYNAGDAASDYISNSAQESKVTFVQVAYQQIKDIQGITLTDSNGAVTNLNVQAVSMNDANAYNVDQYNAGNGTSVDAILIKETGEIVFSANTLTDIQNGGGTIEVQYEKDSFNKSEIRPEMYFACECTNTTTNKTYQYADPTDQDIRYEINFGQTSVINTQAKDAISTDIYRTIDYIVQTVEAMDELEERIKEVDAMIKNETYPAGEKAAVEELQKQLANEKQLRTSVMTEAFSQGLTMVDKAQDKLNVATADLGTRYKRLEMTYEKLQDQQTDTEEKLSNNEDVDIADAYINLSQADNLYQASLSATAKILGNSLLNYI